MLKVFGLLMVMVALCSSASFGAAKEVNQDYALALSAANRFLCAWQTRDQEAGLALASPNLLRKYSESYLRSWISGMSNPHHQSFEISSGRELQEGIYAFSVRLYLHYTGGKWQRPLPKESRIVMMIAGPEEWKVDELPIATTYGRPVGKRLPARHGGVSVLVDGKPLRTTPPAVVRNGRLFLPVTAFRKIGLDVAVDSERHAWVGWPDSDAIHEFRAGMSYYLYGNITKKGQLSSAPYVRDGVLMIPLQGMLHYRDLTAQWDARSRTVNIWKTTDCRP